MIDAVAKPLYENVLLAFMEIPTLRASGLTLPIPGLDTVVSDLGEFHFYEGWADGADKAFTISALMAVRAKIWATRAHTSHTLKVSDASPYLIGERGYGHFWLGNRVATSVLGYPRPDTLFVERVDKLGYSWGKDGPSGWKIGIGYREPEDPMLKAFELIRDFNTGMSDLGIF
jgi:hypothetical protein